MTTTHLTADIVRQLLISLGLGTVSGAWPVYSASEPDTPDSVLTVYDTAGVNHGRSMIDGDLFGDDGFQVRVRSANIVTGRAKAAAIRDALAATYQHTVRVDATAYLVQCASKIGPVLSLGKETPTSRRNLFTVNATLTIGKL